MRSAAEFASEILGLIGDAHVTNGTVLRERCERELEADASVPHSDSAQSLIDAERSRQDAKWGEQNHDPQVWMAILGEEFGELCQAANDLRWPKPVGQQKADPFRHALIEAVQTAAVAKAIVECLLRSTWRWPRPASKYDAAKQYMIASEEEENPRYVQLPFTDFLKSRILVLGETVNDDTLMGDGDQCEAMIALLSGVCGASGLKVVEVPHG